MASLYGYFRSATGRYGTIESNSNNEVTGFVEKPRGDGGLINGGLFYRLPS